MAVWCSYKYLNAGPGAPGGLFLHRRHHDRVPGLPGWWGHDKDRQFAMRPTFEAAQGASGWQIATPSIVATAGLEGALALFEEVTIDEVRERSLVLTSSLVELFEQQVPELEIVTPHEADRRGGHVAVRHPQAAQLSVALRKRRIVPDHRPPDLLRFAPVAFYSLERELERLVEVLRELLDTGLDELETPEPTRVP